VTRRVLLTGFEPFGGDTVNASWEAAKVAAEAAGLAPLQLPVRFGAGFEVLAEAVARGGPGVVLIVGQAGNRSEVCLERVAINLDDARIADNGGDLPDERPIEPGGPAACFAGLPVKRIVEALVSARIPARVSDTAGTYVCNHVFYRASRLAERSDDGMLVGLVHVPPTPAQVAGRPGAPSMATETSARALRLILDFIARDDTMR
jgi:pyroglutamyl-peptidase